MILWEVIEEHFEEAEFLFESWQSTLHSPDYTLDELGETIEQRLAAHLDGLLIGGPKVAEKLLYPAIKEANDPAQATVAALVLLQTDDRADMYQVFDALKNTKDTQQQALALALTLSERPKLDQVLLNQFEQAQAPEEKAVWLEIFAERYLDPGIRLGQCFNTEYLPLLCAALKAASRSGRREFLDYSEYYLQAEAAELRDVAIETGLIFGSQDAWLMCRHVAGEPNELQQKAMLLLALLGGRSDHQLLHAHLEDPNTREGALWALGFTGSVQSADQCIPFVLTDDERLAKLAAETLASIGGFDFINEDAFQAEPIIEEEENHALPPLEEDDLEDDLVPDGVDELPLPNPSAITEWWNNHRDKFSDNQRYIAGQRHSPAMIVQALETHPLRRRHARALELMIRTRGTRLIATNAFSPRQKRQLESLKLLHKQESVNRYSVVW